MKGVRKSRGFWFVVALSALLLVAGLYQLLSILVFAMPLSRSTLASPSLFSYVTGEVTVATSYMEYTYSGTPGKNRDEAYALVQFSTGGKLITVRAEKDWLTRFNSETGRPDSPVVVSGVIRKLNRVKDGSISHTLSRFIKRYDLKPSEVNEVYFLDLCAMTYALRTLLLAAIVPLVSLFCWLSLRLGKRAQNLLTVVMVIVGVFIVFLWNAV